MRKLTIAFILLLLCSYMYAESATDRVAQVSQDGSDHISCTLQDTMPPSKPRSKNRYYPDKEVDGLYIAGGRFDHFDMTNIVYHYEDNANTNNMNKVLVRIDFFDDDNQLRGTYDVKANNPYTSEKYRPFLSESYMDASRSIIDRRKQPDYDWRPDVKYYASMIILNENRSCETVGVVFFLQMLGEDYTLLGVTATFVMLDNHGREIARMNDIEDVFLGEGLLTCDHKYFVFRYGGNYTTEFERMYNDHLRIYDVATGEIIYEWELPQEYSIVGPAEQKGGWIWVNKQLTDISAVRKGQAQTSIYHAFDIPNRLIYIAPDDPELSFLIKFTDDGFLTKNFKTNAYRLVRYKDWASHKF